MLILNLNRSLPHHCHGNSCVSVKMIVDSRVSEIHFLCTESPLTKHGLSLYQKQRLPAPVQEPHSPALYTQPLHPAGQRHRHTLNPILLYGTSPLYQSTGETHPQAEVFALFILFIIRTARELLRIINHLE